jgi:hypothetical protein
MMSRGVWGEIFFMCFAGGKIFIYVLTLLDLCRRLLSSPSSCEGSVEEVWVWRPRFWGFTCWALGCSIPLGFPFFGLGLVEWGDFVTFFVWHVPMHFYIYHSCSRVTGRRTLDLVNYLYSMAIIDWTSTCSLWLFSSVLHSCESFYNQRM